MPVLPATELGNPVSFLRRSCRILEWGDLSRATVMDAGCGNGYPSTAAIVDLRPRVQRVIAVDVDPDEVEAAKYENSHPAVEYHVANITDMSTLSRWEDQIDVLVSHYCLNCIENQQQALQNIFHLLVPGGSAAVIFTLRADYYEWFQELVAHWKEFAQDVKDTPPLSHLQSLEAKLYEKIVTEIGFEVLLCQEEGNTYVFKTDYQCKSYLDGLICFSKNIPKELKKKFNEEAFSSFVKCVKRNEEDKLCMDIRSLTMLLRKSSNCV